MLTGVKVNIREMPLKIIMIIGGAIPPALLNGQLAPCADCCDDALVLYEPAIAYCIESVKAIFPTLEETHSMQEA